MKFLERYRAAKDAAALDAVLNEAKTALKELEAKRKAASSELETAALDASDQEISKIQARLRDAEESISLQHIRIMRLSDEVEKRRDDEEAAEIERLHAEGKALSEEAVERFVKATSPLFDQIAAEIDSFEQSRDQLRQIGHSLKSLIDRRKETNPRDSKTGFYLHADPEILLQNKYPAQGNNFVRGKTFFEMLKLPHPAGKDLIWPRY